MIDGGSPAIRVDKHNPWASVITDAASDPYGGYFARTFPFTVTANETRTIDEDSPVGTAVGDPVAGTPYYDGDDQTDDALSYTLTGEAETSGAFTIDPATGQISVIGSGCAALDYETKTFYTGQVNYTVNGNAVAVPVAINVNGLAAEVPCAPGALTITRNESNEPMNPALDVTWTVPADNGTAIAEYLVRYRKQAAEGEEPGGWESVIATATEAKLPNLQAGSVYEAQVRTIAGVEGSGLWSDTGEGTANRPPVVRAIIGQLYETLPFGRDYDRDITDYINDPDGDTLTYSAPSAHAGVVAAELTGNGANTLTVTVLNPASATIAYGAQDGYGGYVERTVNVTGRRRVSLSIVENSPAGTSVGDPVTGKPYNGETLSYALNGNVATSGLFVIDSATVQIRVIRGASLDREAGISYTGQVEYKVQGQSAVIGLTVEVTDCPRPRPRTRPLWRRRKPRVPTPRPCWPWTGKRRNQQPCLL